MKNANVTSGITLIANPASVKIYKPEKRLSKQKENHNSKMVILIVEKACTANAGVLFWVGFINVIHS